MPDNAPRVKKNTEASTRRPAKRPDYSRGNGNWNTEAYERSVRTPHTDTTAVKSGKDGGAKGPYYFDNTASAIRERRIKSMGERQRRMRDAMKNNRHRFGAARRILSLLLIIGAVFAAGTLSYKFLFVASAVTVSGDTSYTEEEIVAASGLDKKPNLYSFSASEAAKSLMFYCPRITKAEISRTMPNKVRISVVEEKPSYYAEIYGDIYAISDSLRVMGKIGADETSGLIRLRLQTVESAVSGEKLKLVSERAQSFLEHATSYISESPLKSKLTQMDLRSDFNTVMVAQDKYKLVFGTQDDFEIKVRLAVATLEDDMFKTGTRALINLQDTTKTSVIIDNQLEFD